MRISLYYIPVYTFTSVYRNKEQKIELVIQVSCKLLFYCTDENVMELIMRPLLSSIYIHPRIVIDSDNSFPPNFF